MGWLSMALLAATSTTVPETTDKIVSGLREEHPALFTAPTVPDWPGGLGMSYDTPDLARCVDFHGYDLGQGTWVPSDLGREVQRRLLMLDAYPARAQAVIDGLVPRVIVAVAERAISEPDESAWRWVKAGLLVVGSVALVGVGMLAGWGLHSAIDAQ